MNLVIGVVVGKGAAMMQWETLGVIEADDGCRGLAGVGGLLLGVALRMTLSLGIPVEAACIGHGGGFSVKIPVVGRSVVISDEVEAEPQRGGTLENERYGHC